MIPMIGPWDRLKLAVWIAGARLLTELDDAIRRNRPRRDPADPIPFTGAAFCMDQLYGVTHGKAPERPTQ